MRLQEIVNSPKAWQTLSALKKNPKLAYRLLKYEKKVTAELDACTNLRNACLYEAAGVEAPTPPDVLVVQIPQTIKDADGKDVENPQFAAFVAKYSEVLEGESDLDVIGIGMDELIEALGAEVGNVLSESDLMALEPFFQEKAKPDLKLVAES